MAKCRLNRVTSVTLAGRSSELDKCHTLTLDDLPTELIWHIASYLKTPTLIRNFDELTVRKRRYDLCALRLACRSMHDKVQKVFVPTAFDSLEVDLTRSDLDALIEIAKDKAWPEPDDWSEAYEQEALSRDYTEKGSGAILLSRALNGFPNLEAVRVQPVMWFPGNPRFILSRWPHGEGSTTSLVATILAALSLSNTRIKTLAFSRQPPFTDHLNGPTGCYISQLSIPPSAMAAFHHLRTLDLVIALRPSKRFDFAMASALTSFVSGLKQLASLSIRFDSHILSEIVMRDFLSDCQVLAVTWFRLEVAWIWDTSSGCPLIEFMQRNRQIQHFYLAFVDLDEGRWPALIETLSTCENLQSVGLRYVSEANHAVTINGKDKLHIEHTEDMASSLKEAKRGISVGNSDHDEFPAARYDRYPDDSEYDSSEEA
ncbi:hypothetical protein C7974DRAFT_377674 [Boeremia exigua]|uniref:uncharacterized protein n=1 Tax=Boeremia exigua TaxID=749465 RepID=UPI001E8EEEC2|nr:uncharacterized protein C7974DRAFT_377674 [Boeremia exigua]KAH6622050.1 hypothetical protein C7974DRAFT_377674 [Boeremia exigua]